MRAALRATFSFALAALASTSCASAGVPDPKETSRLYADAAVRGDADALYAMMTDEARRARTKDEVRMLVQSAKSELAEKGKAIASADATRTTTARLRYDDGEEVALEYEGGHFSVASAGSIPGGGRTPEEALEALRRAMARRSYSAMLTLLTPATRAAIERDLRGLVLGLERPETLPVDVSGDGASVVVPGGHHVRLKRDAGLWRIEDFD